MPHGLPMFTMTQSVLVTAQLTLISRGLEKMTLPETQ